MDLCCFAHSVSFFWRQEVEAQDDVDVVPGDLRALTSGVRTRLAEKSAYICRRTFI